MTDTPQPAADVRSIGIQCNILAVPSLKELKCKDDIIEDITEESEVEETDVDTSSLFPGGYYNRVSTNSSTLIDIKLTLI